ncbi:hypothetical protein Tco_0474924 [Tanacetum coccineum]
MTGNIAHLSYFKDFDGGYVTFGRGAYGGRITGKGTIKTDNLDFDDVYFVKELSSTSLVSYKMCAKRTMFFLLFWNVYPIPTNFKLLMMKSDSFFKFLDRHDMELESTNSGPTAKLPILKLGEYEMWAIRIKQYFQIQDYALWEVIENGDSSVSVPQTS